MTGSTKGKSNERTTKTMHRDDRTKTMQKNKRIREWMRGPEWKRRMDERFIPQTLNIGFFVCVGEGGGWVGAGMGGFRYGSQSKIIVQRSIYAIPG